MTAPKKTIDVLGQRVGTVYAKALYDAAQGEAAAVIQEFQSLVGDVLDAFPDFEKLLASPMIPADQKRDIVQRTLGGQISPLLLNFLRVVAKNERLGNLRAILGCLIDLHNQRSGRVRVDVTTATTLADSTAAALKDRIRSLLGREPELVVRTDPRLIGGLQLRVGDTVYDGSVLTNLQQLRSRLRQRNVEEIETNRQRFQFTPSKL
ncbi:MAG: ATP synthase F1 subunit delta [Planctomycetales bacterium]|nr:ATP synthase F1 subunit delta [Planctomycetales bacterium]NIM09781.1 ATP synthase F1 subunit delta [Planctomycetales bacterium]NIN09250.1 ATP synthase F1 subunit delta [Planctomycetales bacterium]NIN78350.1 ATP synthase F1 subunit delta [Planctomycetales bacterium]NIO35529.1 ATP synthase F1 subunit delta [Planctomycetales bacterium]